ncbi:hypothetical protein SEA_VALENTINIPUFF_80 [Microbacterium phage ValentiniPuff]|uniref:Uncharacterized protein n=1 Tax=Microbacterium phage ValentiniPuff TaxID=2315705 RepID=A0A386KP61_9CAUD|nr:hypothetical protein SEA_VALENTINIPUFF_80 [Microbacterium phage ValentiniPuff]
MLELIWTSLALAVVHAVGEEGGTPQNGTLVIDLLNMQWWQALGAFIAALGISPAPWLLGLATGKIQFTSTADAAHARELAAREKAYEDQLAQMEKYHGTVVAQKDERYDDLVRTNARNIEVADQQKARGDKLEDALTQAAVVIEQNSHVLLELKQSAEEVTPGG